MVIRRPIGVCAAITPYNFPLTLLGTKVAPALASGNTVVAKPAATTPLATLEVARLFSEAGVPDGVLNVVTGRGSEIGDALVGHPDVRRVAFTGSTSVGRHVAALAAPDLKRLSLELGGSDPFILLSSDDLDATVEAAIDGRFENTGQACNAAKRIIVDEGIYDDFLDKFTKKVLEKAEGLAPLSSLAAAERLDEQVKRAVDDGATLVSEGERKGAHFPPGVLTNVSPDSPSYKEELFVPVATVYKASSEDEAVQLANDTPFGLGSYVFTTDDEQAKRVADQIEAGMVFVNAVGAEGVELPFGGVKRSGFGRELGRYGIDEFVNKKLIRIS